VVVTPFSLRRILLVVGAVLFALAAFSAGGDALGHVPAWSWAFGALGAWCSSGAVP
jgi:hypothetical protein